LKRRRYWLLVLLTAGVGLSACTSHHKPAPVEDRSWQRSPAQKKTRDHRHRTKGASRIVIGPSYGANRPASVIVRPGETLYAISFRYNLDLKQVARWNHLQPPYTIYPGQKLRLTASGHTTGSTPAKKTAKKTAAKPGQSTKKQKGSSAHRPDVVVRSAQKTPAASSAKKSSRPLSKKKPAHKNPVALKNPSHWAWPAKGPLASSFSATDPARKGIVIAGKPGHPVRAAASGVVVYSGNALKAYGQLVIIKHSDTFLSAYGFNRRSLVKEGQAVSQGQTIAEMGTSPAGRPGLKFEIRKNGQPVNPLKYLPRQ
jgi:lipoprotein NlpD